MGFACHLGNFVPLSPFQSLISNDQTVLNFKIRRLVLILILEFDAWGLVFPLSYRRQSAIKINDLAGDEVGGR